MRHVHRIASTIYSAPFRARKIGQQCVSTGMSEIACVEIVPAAEAVAGSRRETDSAALIGGSRNARGRLFIQIWQYLLPELSNQIVDTNRAFKAFTSSGLQRIIDHIGIYTFPYQIELLQACISEGVPLEKRGIAYVDSEAASTQHGDAITETYLHQIHKIASDVDVGWVRRVFGVVDKRARQNAFAPRGREAHNRRGRSERSRFLPHGMNIKLFGDRIPRFSQVIQLFLEHSW